MEKKTNTIGLSDLITVGSNIFYTTYNAISDLRSTKNDAYISDDNIDYYFNTLLKLSRRKLHPIEKHAIEMCRAYAKSPLNNSSLVAYSNVFSTKPNYIESIKTISNKTLNNIFDSIYNFILNNYDLIFNYELRNFMLESTYIIRDKIKSYASNDLDLAKAQTIWLY